MKITVDHNNDEVIIQEERKGIIHKIKFTPHTNMKGKGFFITDVQSILEEIFNLIDTVNPPIELEKISEDTRTTIGEW